MGKRLSISQPVVIDTQLNPLNDSFWLDVNGPLEQWYFVNTGTFAPNRVATPLLIEPHVTATDPATGTNYTPTFLSVEWTVLRYVGDRYVSFRITTRQGGSNFYLVDNKLCVACNNPDTEHAIKVICSATYIDPRDVNRTQVLEDTLLLTTSRDANVMYPDIRIDAPASIPYNPLSDASSQFTLHAVADWSNVADTTGVEGNGTFVWMGILNKAEVPIDTLPCYVSGQHTATLVVDAMYGKDIPVVLRIKKASTDSDRTGLLPSKAQSNIVWSTPPIGGIVTCRNGNTVRLTDTRDYVFDTIVSTNAGVLDEEVVARHLRFNWKLRRATPRTEGSSTVQPETATDIGWCRQKHIKAKDLYYTTTRQNASKLVMNDIYMLGALEAVKKGSSSVTYNGQQVYGRGID